MSKHESARARTDGRIFTVVSMPGPIERSVLGELAPGLVVRRRVGAGVSLRTIETASERLQSEQSPTVVLLHGRGHSASLWAPILSAISSRHRLMAIDLPGFGHSGSPPLAPAGDRALDDPRVGLAFFSRPIEDLVGGLGPVILIGHSLGALVALDLALGGKVDVVGIGLVSAMGLSPYASPRSRLYLRANPERIARATKLAHWISGSASTSLADPLVRMRKLREELMTVRGGRPEATRAFDSMVRILGPLFHFGDELERLRQPVLLLWGENDEAFPLPIAVEAQGRLANAELVILPAGHSPHLQVPERTATALLDWLERFARRPVGLSPP